MRLRRKHVFRGSEEVSYDPYRKRLRLRLDREVTADEAQDIVKLIENGISWARKDAA